MKIPRFSIDDYNSDNIKLANLFKKYDLIDKTIFFIECFSGETQQQIKELSKLGFTIGSHTMTHAFLNEVEKEQAFWEINASKKIIEELTGKPCEAFCFPRGRYDDKIIKMVKDAGYKWARTTKLEHGKTPFERAGVHLSYARSEYEGKDPFEVAKESNLGHYWLHYFEVERYYLFDKLESFLAWYKKGGQVAKKVSGSKVRL